MTLGFPVGSAVKNPPARQEMQVRSLGREDPREKEMATHSSSLAREIPWTEDIWDPLSMGLQRVGHNLATKQQQCEIKIKIYFSAFEYPICWKEYPLPIKLPWYMYWNSTTCVWVYFSTLYSVPLICMSILMPVPPHLDYSSFIISLKIR